MTAPRLASYCGGAWREAGGSGVALRDATTGAVIAEAAGTGPDPGMLLTHAREVGGPALRALGFHERAARLKSLARSLDAAKAELYALSYATGATAKDAWIDIDGGIGTLFVYASKGLRELPEGNVTIDGATERISKQGTFLGQHLCVPLEGAAVHINAFNFPVWGMLEKLAPALLAGVPAIVKPATQTCYLAERAFRLLLGTGLFPEGSLQLVCGPLGNLFGQLTCQDVVSFTGSAATAQQLRGHPRVLGSAVRFTAETDSLNCSILGADAGPGSAELALFVGEVVREMTVKAGQKCTAIRRALVPAARAQEVREALRAALGGLVIGDPRREEVAMGPLASLGQRREVLERLGRMTAEAQIVCGGGVPELAGADPDRGAFVAPTLLWCADGARAAAVHEVEAFGPVCTLMPYADAGEAIALARRGGGSLAASIFTADDALAATLVRGLAPYHGRIVVVNRHCARESTGHGSPLPHLVHGGPGRAGGGEELGGVRGLMHYLQRTALQGTADTITATAGRWIRGARERDPGVHPFRKTYGELVPGDTFHSAEREVTLADIERFAELSGDRFYAHMDEAAAARNPLFGGRVAHGYFLVAAAAGLFVDPPYGPVLANYGIDGLRFLKPVKPGDRIRVRLTCKEKSLRRGSGYGEVRWDTEIQNQDGETVASYDVLTLVSEAR